MAKVKFGNVVKEYKGKIDQKNNPYEFYVAGDHMDTDDLTIRRRGRFATDDVGPAFIREFKKGQVLYGSRRTYLRKIAVADFDGVTANTTFVLETKDESILRQRLLPFIMYTESFTEWSIKKSKGSTNPYVLFKDLADYEFELPDIGKQDELVELLWSMIDTRDAYNNLIVSIDELVKSQFIERFEGQGYAVVKAKTFMTNMRNGVYVTCINDPKYITVDLTGGGAELKLTDYAREHVAECCLVYSYRSTSYLKDEYEFYGESYLSKEVKADYYVEHTYDKDFNYKCVQTADQISEAVAAYNAAQDAEKKVRMEMAAKGCDTFADSLKYHMTRKKVKVEELSERSGLSDTTIKNYRSGTIPYPPIENVMAVCIGLNLHRPYCIDLLRTANYQINNDDPRSRAYRFLLDYTDGTLQQWNMILDQFGQPHIPYQRNQKIAE